MKFLKSCVVGLVAGSALIGCGGYKDAKMADVSGTVTLKGKPLADAEVHFVAGSFEGYGRTDEKGFYQLVRGAPIGECKVYITKAEMGGKAGGIDTSIPGMDEEQIRAMRQGQGRGAGAKKPLLPAEYSDPKKTKLTFTVPAGGTKEADFKL
jgi:hypothetical protein